MRLHFPNGEHADVFWAEGRLTLGSSADQRVCLAHAAVLPVHMAFECDPVRGIEVFVNSGAEVHLNTRLVREKALVRLGDTLLIGPVQCLIKADSDVREPPPESFQDLYGPGIRNLAARAVLRAVSGQHFGKLLGLRTRTVIGSGIDCDLIIDEPDIAGQHAVIESTSRGVFLRGADNEKLTQVNGIAVGAAILRQGDQLAYGHARFVLELIGGNPMDANTQPNPVSSNVTTQVGMKLIPPPPTEVLSTLDTDATELPYWTRLLGNMLMMLAAICALGGIVWAVLRHLGKI
jgi:hypothetical protein